MEKALNHAIAWGLQNIYDTNKEANALFENKEIDEKDKLAALHGPHGIDHRLLNYLCLLKPLIDHAKVAYADHKDFFPWFEEKWKMVEDQKLLNGDCGCKGCKVTE